MTTPGWYPDPSDPSLQRYFDGTAWTEHTARTQPVADPASQQPPFVADQSAQPASWPPASTSTAAPSSKPPLVLGIVGLVALLAVVALFAIPKLAGSDDKKDVATPTTTAKDRSPTTTESISDMLGPGVVYFDENSMDDFGAAVDDLAAKNELPSPTDAAGEADLTGASVGTVNLKGCGQRFDTGEVQAFMYRVYGPEDGDQVVVVYAYGEGVPGILDEASAAFESCTDESFADVSFDPPAAGAERGYSFSIPGESFHAAAAVKGDALVFVNVANEGGTLDVDARALADELWDLAYEMQKVR